MSAPTPTPPKPKQIPVSEVRSGQRITGRVFPDGEVTTFRRPIKVDEVVECPGQWRTHVHIGSGCWDGRTLVEIS